MAGWNDSGINDSCELQKAIGETEQQVKQDANSKTEWRKTVAAAAVAVIALLLLAISIVGTSNGMAFDPMPVAVEQDNTGTEASETENSIQYTAVGCTLYDVDGLCVKLIGTASDNTSAWLKVEITNSGKEERAVSLARVILSCGTALLQSDKAFVTAGEYAVLEIEVPGGAGGILPMTGYVTVQESQDLRYAGSMLDSKQFKVKG